ncbi:hypothetical protein ACT7DN_30295 [Bacillus paranthracis]
MPLKELGSKRIGYGTVSTAPFITVVLISKKERWNACDAGYP